MSKEKLMLEIYKIYKDTKKEIIKLDKIIIKNKEMVNVDMELSLKAQAYQQISDLFSSLEKRKQESGQNEE